MALTINGVPQILDNNRTVFYTATHTPALADRYATAVDSYGNIGTGQPNPPLRVLDPNDNTPPVVEITFIDSIDCQLLDRHHRL
ncbi:MAG: hypothetical protein R3C28_30960 [Pirellulaceae bacterium]